jgi:F0F1-type ATP synthase assembly protein I
MITGKQGGMSDLFLFMIFSMAILFISGIFIYFGGKVNSEVHAKLDGMTFKNSNVTEVIDNTLGKVNEAYQSLYWISVFLIIGMIISIFIGSYLVTTKPIFFVPYLFIVIIAVIVAVGLSNAYETVIQDPTLASSFVGFVGANFIMLKLPLWVAIIGVTGGIIMFVRMGSKENDLYGGNINGY